jgi:hypothetical protein
VSSEFLALQSGDSILLPAKHVAQILPLTYLVFSDWYTFHIRTLPLKEFLVSRSEGFIDFDGGVGNTGNFFFLVESQEGNKQRNGKCLGGQISDLFSNTIAAFAVRL